jgi:hypothetical protein
MMKKISVHVTVAASLLLLSVQIAFAQTDASVPNPLNPAFSSIPQFIAGALKVLVMVALPIITLFFVYSGFLFVKARGNPAELSKAKNNFIAVVIGAILILGAWVIATLIGGTVTKLLGT